MLIGMETWVERDYWLIRHRGISLDMILQQADLIFKSAFFKGSPLLCRLFDFLLTESLAGRGPLLSQYVIGIEVLKKSRKFDPDKDPIVRVHAGRLRQALFKYYAGPGSKDPIVIQMPAGGYELTFADATPESLDSGLAHLGTARPVVAVLEFLGLGLNDPWTIFPAVLAEELSVVLGSTADLRVVGPLYRAAIEPDMLDPLRLAQRYAADFIIDGSMQRSGGSHSLRVRLLEGATGAQVWSQRYECGGDLASDLAGLEIDIMKSLAHEVGADFGVMNTRLSALAQVEPHQARSVFEAVLNGRRFFKEFTAEAYQLGVTSLRQAIHLAPNEALPRATLASLHVAAWNEEFCTDTVPSAEIDSEAKRAFELRPENPWSLIALLCAAAIHHRGEELAELATHIAAHAGGSKVTRGTAGLWLIYRRVDLPLGRRLIAEAMDLNPHYPRVFHLSLALACLCEGDNDGAIHEIGQFSPQPYWCVHLVQAAVYARQGDAEKAQAQWQELLQVFPDFAARGFQQCRRLWHHDYAQLMVASLRRVGIDADPSASR